MQQQQKKSPKRKINMNGNNEVNHLKKFLFAQKQEKMTVRKTHGKNGLGDSNNQHLHLPGGRKIVVFFFSAFLSFV